MPTTGTYGGSTYGSGAYGVYTAIPPLVTTKPRYRLVVRDASLNLVAEVENYTECTISPRFNQLGAWVLELPADTPAAEALVEGAGLVVVRNGTVLLSGPMTHREDVGDERGDRVRASGYDDNVVLADRLALPCAWPYTAQEADVRTGVCETVLRAYVAANAVTGGSWLSVTAGHERAAVTGLALAADAAQGATVTGRARFVNLLELLTDLALSGGDLGFRVVQTLTVPATLEFQVYVPADRTATAVFSREMGNLRGYEYAVEAPTGNHVIVGGQGEGVARTFRERTDTASITQYSRRIEIFKDRRDTNSTTELDQDGDTELAQRQERGQLKLEPLDTAGLAFLNSDTTRTYALGDKVTVVVRGAPVQDVVREVRITLTARDGEVLEPVVGTPGAMLTHTNTFVLRHLHKRLSLVERR